MVAFGAGVECVVKRYVYPLLKAGEDNSETVSLARVHVTCTQQERLHPSEYLANKNHIFVHILLPYVPLNLIPRQI